MNYFRENKIISFLILVLIILNLSTLAFCWILWSRVERNQDFRQGMSDNHPMERNIIEDQLKLNAEQRKEFSQFREKHFASKRIINDKINSIRDQLFDMIKSDHPDSNALNNLAAKIGEAEAQKQLEIVRHFEDLRKVCNPDQKDKFDTWINDVVKLICPQGPPPPHNHDRPPFPPSNNFGPPPPR
jgi:protein CpxP